MANAQVEFGGERMGPESAPTAGSPLPSRSARANANNAKAWTPSIPIVPVDAADGPVTTRCDACGGMS